MKFFHRRSDDQKRDAYRVRTARAPLRVVLIDAEVARPVELLDVASGGCAVRAPRGDLAGLAEGAEVALRFEAALAAAHARNIYARAVVRSVIAQDEFTRVGVQFLDRERVWEQLDDGLWRYFNRREAFRVTPARDRSGPATVRLTLGSEVRTDLLHDLSTTGLALRVSTKDPSEFPSGELARAAFELPVEGGPFDLGVIVVHDTRIRGSRRIGFRFDPVSTPQLAHEQERILQYVLGRQRALLQRRRLVASPAGSNESNQP